MYVMENKKLIDCSICGEDWRSFNYVPNLARPYDNEQDSKQI